MKTQRIFKVIFLFFCVCCISFNSCVKEDSDEITEELEEDFEPIFNYHIYGSGYSYNSSTKMFTYNVFVHNKGNIGIILDESNSKLNRNDIFQVGIATLSASGFHRYSVTFQKNEFLAGEGKLGHEISPGDVLKIEVIGIVNGNVTTSPNAVKLYNLRVFSFRYKQFEEKADRVLTGG